MSDNVNDPPPVLKPDVASQDVLVRKEEVEVTKESSKIYLAHPKLIPSPQISSQVLKDMELHRQKIQEAKGIFSIRKVEFISACLSSMDPKRPDDCGWSRSYGLPTGVMTFGS